MLEVCEHNWFAVPGEWAIERLPENARARKEWLHGAALVRWYLDLMDCQCASFLRLLVREDLDDIPLWDTAITMSDCHWNCPRFHEKAPSQVTCPAYQLLQMWEKYSRGYLTPKELTNSFGELQLDMEVIIAAKQDGEALRQHRRARGKYQRQLIVDLLGNPFQPVEPMTSWLEWRDGILPAIAQSICDRLAFDEMPILADALEEAGCTDSTLLSHCRQQSFHVRGCWALDLLLETN
jgi:hypothetical protein